MMLNTSVSFIWASVLKYDCKFQVAWVLAALQPQRVWSARQGACYSSQVAEARAEEHSGTPGCGQGVLVQVKLHSKRV